MMGPRGRSIRIPEYVWEGALPDISFISFPPSVRPSIRRGREGVTLMGYKLRHAAAGSGRRRGGAVKKSFQLLIL